MWEGGGWRGTRVEDRGVVIFFRGALFRAYLELTPLLSIDMGQQLEEEK